MAELKKCIVWDLDNTLWNGIALEGNIEVKPDARKLIEILDQRGILHSIASRGEEDLALRILRENNLDGYFVCPKINWLPKSNNIIEISRELRLSLDTMAFIDDDDFELEQIGYMLPAVMVIKATRVSNLLNMPEFTPREVTQEARLRRQFYQAERQRELASPHYPTREEFLKSCAMRLKIRSMGEADIPRVKELMTRTHQLNTTGRTYATDEIRDILQGGRDSRMIKIAELTDRFGSYGLIGVAIIGCQDNSWRLEYLALSCRVLGRGIERAFLAWLLQNARERGLVHAEALFRDTGRNRMMRTLYQMMGFRVSEGVRDGESLIFRTLTAGAPRNPPWVEIL